jgi:hypothetical protein
MTKFTHYFDEMCWTLEDMFGMKPANDKYYESSDSYEFVDSNILKEMPLVSLRHLHLFRYNFEMQMFLPRIDQHRFRFKQNRHLCS